MECLRLKNTTSQTAPRKAQLQLCQITGLDIRNQIEDDRLFSRLLSKFLWSVQKPLYHTGNQCTSQAFLRVLGGTIRQKRNVQKPGGKENWDICFERLIKIGILGHSRNENMPHELYSRVCWCHKHPFGHSISRKILGVRTKSQASLEFPLCFQTLWPETSHWQIAKFSKSSPD